MVLVKTLVQVLRGKPFLSRRSRRWASLTLLTTSLLIAGATAVTSYWLVRQIILDSVKTNAQLTVEKAGDDIDQWLATRVAEVETLANQVAIRSMHLEAVIPFLSLEADRLPEYDFLLYAYPDGSHYRTDKGFVRDHKLASAPYFKRAIAGQTRISGLMHSNANAPQQVSIAAPIWSASPLRRKISKERAEIRAENLYAFGLPSNPYQKPKPVGVLVGVIPVKHIADEVAAIPKVPGSYAFILDAQGKPIAHPEGSRLSQTDNLLSQGNPVWKPVYQTMVQQKQGVQRVKLGQEWVYVAYAPLRQANWSIALVIPTEQVENQLNALNTLAMVVAGVFAIATMIGVQQLRLLEQAEDRSTELAETNRKLQQEVQERQRAEAALLKSQAELENRVAARTAELATANQVLQTSEAQLKQQAFQLEQMLQELQQTQTHLIQTEKMSSLGQMIAGVAHEINNPVNFIHANLPYAERYMQDLIELVKVYQAHYPDPVPAVQAKADEIDLDFLIHDLTKVLESMQMGTERIRQLVLSLRNFSRLDEAEKKEVDIHEGLENTLLILQNRLKPKPGYLGIQIIKDYSNPYPVECYPGQLNQVFMNILANAIDALETTRLLEPAQAQESTSFPLYAECKAIAAEREGVTPSHRVIPQEVDTLQSMLSCPLPTIWIQTTVVDERWIEIRIADNGSGMPDEIRKKVFDPFFTTKPVGKGTGIGMSISYQIVVEKHGGQLLCNSTLGEGTEFVIRIPAHQSRAKSLGFDEESISSFEPAIAQSHSTQTQNSWVNPPIL